MGRPKKAFRNKGIDIAAWENDRGGMSFTLRKTYKNKEPYRDWETDRKSTRLNSSHRL